MKYKLTLADFYERLAKCECIADVTKLRHAMGMKVVDGRFAEVPVLSRLCKAQFQKIRAAVFHFGISVAELNEIQRMVRQQLSRGHWTIKEAKRFYERLAAAQKGEE